MTVVNKTQKAKEISRILEDLYPETPIPLHHSDPFRLLISVLLSAQCTDKRVNKITPHLFKQANNPFDMVQMRVEDIEEVIRPCGLSPRKSKAISQLSKLLVENYQGEVPQTFQELEELPGVGHKTASVVMSQAFGKPAFPVDTHIHRLAYRWGLSNGKNVEQTEKDLKKLFPKSQWNKLHLRIIYFGREYCSARGHDMTECPICGKYGRKSLVKDLSKKKSSNSSKI